MMEAFQAALADFRRAFQLHRVWIALAHEDIGDAHRRTALGPVWLLLNYLAFAGTFILLFHRGDSLPNGPAYIATGLFVWLYVSEVISQSIVLFAREENFIKGTPLPLPVYVMRLTMQSGIRAIYTLFGCGLILLLSKFPIAIGALWALPGIVLILLMTPAIVLILAFVGAYFPDLQHIVGNLMRVGMFVTPVFWAPTQADGIRQVFYHYSPFTYMLELVRTPVLLNEPPLLAYGVVGALALVLWIAALQILGRLRRELVFAL